MNGQEGQQTVELLESIENAVKQLSPQEIDRLGVRLLASELTTAISSLRVASSLITGSTGHLPIPDSEIPVTSNQLRNITYYLEQLLGRLKPDATPPTQT